MWWDRLWEDVVRGKNVPEKHKTPREPIPFREWVLTADFTRFTLDPFVRDDTQRLCDVSVLRVENLEKDLRLVAERLRLAPPPRLERLNLTAYVPYAYDEEMATRVLEAFSTDFEIGGYSSGAP